MSNDSNIIEIIQDKDFDEVLNYFLIIKDEYIKMNKPSPCLVIQKLNQDMSNEFLNNKIFSILNQIKYQSLKWILLSSKEDEWTTNNLLLNHKDIDLIILKSPFIEDLTIMRDYILFLI